MAAGWFAIFYVACVAALPRVGCSFFDRPQKVLVMKGLKMCKGAEDLPLQWHDVFIRRDRTTKDMTMDLRLVITKAITGPFSMEFNFLKCDRSGNLGSCEYLVKGYKNKEICQHMVEKNQGWTPFMEAFSKPLVCPMQPGEYKIEHMVMSSEILSRVPLPEAMWKINMKGFEGDTIISCVNFEAIVAKEEKRKSS